MVPSHGPRDADVCVVGEAPGREEMEQQRPFVGRSGQLLTKILRQVGVKRDDVFVTNAVLCYVPGNPTPKRKALMACRGRLLREINERRPSQVLAFGGPAGRALLNTRDAVSKLRVGGAKKHDDLPGASIIPTFHPAFALRNPDAFPSIIEDLSAPARVSVKWEPTQFKVEASVESALDSLKDQLKSSKELALDIENDPSMPTAPAWLCIGISHRPGHAVVYDRPVVEHPRFQAFLASALANRERSWVYQFGSYDVKYLWSFAPDARVDEDSGLAHYSVDERKGTHDLEQLATKYLGAPSYKTEARSYKKDDEPMSMLPPDILHRYNATDVDCTLRLMEPLRKEMAADDVEMVYRELLIPGSNVLARVERHGIRADIAHIDRLKEEFGERAAQAEKRIRDTWGSNPRSYKQILERFMEDGLDLPSTNKEILGELLHMGVSANAKELASAVLRYRRWHKQLSTYVEGNRKHIRDGRIHPNYKLHGTEVGRLSSSNPNIQNQTREYGIRDIFTADEGCVFLSADYAQIEYRVAAILAKDEPISQAFREGRNLHDEAAREFYGTSYKGKKDDHERYTNVKTINFGSLYHETPRNLSRRQHVPYKDAKGLVDLFNKRHAGIRSWQRRLAKEVLTRQVLTSHFGRKRRFWLITEENRYDILKEAYAFVCQAPASDLALQSLIRLEPMLRGVAVPLITIHDALVWQTTPDVLEDVARTVKTTMEENPWDVPTPVELSVGESWGQLRDLELPT